ncbi:hypothetical protein [Aliihoeflea sp. 40Bstr573]|uniref:hypothetical protein n=1 Tax=Aliihoeflea sp. 40Bstr573 TaxID=2696467 RepID=UPI002094053C|nr:hypothetical protein [Aliihoeflea sp. 40Bstr573]MCO6386225.1 hypothetical protein [Aliihoeflea sp. 40Bstr573]
MTGFDQPPPNAVGVQDKGDHFIVVVNANGQQPVETRFREKADADRFANLERRRLGIAPI